MKKIGNIVLLQILMFSLYGQDINPSKIELADTDRQFELYQEESGLKQDLIIKKLNGEIIKKIALHDEQDPYRFVEKYSGDRSFMVISGRYRFYLFNTNTEKLIGPINSSPRGDAEDAQSGVWYAFKVIYNGQYLLANALDFGLYCYDLSDLYHPKEVDYINPELQGIKPPYTFIDLRKDNIYNVITASCGNYNREISTELELIGYKFQQDSLGNPDHKIIDNRFLTLKHIKPDLSVEDLIIDMHTGQLTGKIDN